jgi:hypothetical protein
MDPKVADFVKNNSSCFLGKQTPFFISGVDVYMSRPFQLYLATQNPYILTHLCDWLVIWEAADGSGYKKGFVDKIKIHPIQQCSCPDKKVCPQVNTCTLDIRVNFFTGKPTKKASLCLFNKNRDKFPFGLSPHESTVSPDVFIDTVTNRWKDVIKDFMNGTFTSKLLDSAAKKIVYEKNKTSQHCVSCGRPTQEKALFTSVIQYCPCIEC